MSDLETITELLNKDCFCHNSELNYMFECMPATIKQPRVRKDCQCYHAQEKEIKQTLRQFKHFMETESKFKIGDSVELNHSPVINATTAWGWLGHRHILVKGAKATIIEISYYGNEFSYLLQFDNDNSWIDEKDIVHPNSDLTHRHNFSFREDSLSRVGSTPFNCDFLRKLWSDFYKIGD